MEILIRVFLDGGQWCALIGENLQEGVAGFGETLAESVLSLGEALKKEPPPTLNLAYVITGAPSPEAMQLWKEFFNKDKGAMEADHGDTESCFFCGEIAGWREERHKPDCIYLRAKEMLEREKVCGYSIE